MYDEEALVLARKILDVSEDADGEMLQAAYLSGVNRESISPEQLDALNNSLEILIDYGYKTRSHFDLLTIRVTCDGKTEVTRIAKPQFHYTCWNPFTTHFSSFEFAYFGSRRSEQEKNKEILYFYLPYKCLNKLIFMSKKGYLLDEKDPGLYEENKKVVPCYIDEIILLNLVRTSFNGRSNIIDKTEIGATLGWRITKESERYPYSIEVLTLDGESLGELPNAFSACLTPLLISDKISIDIKVHSIVTRKERGKYARCSWLGVEARIKVIDIIEQERYFNNKYISNTEVNMFRF